MASVGTAFVDVRADLSKFSADVDQGASSLMAKFGAAIKDNLGKIAIVGAAVALEQIGEKFDEAFDKIRIQTGATGDALKGLEGDFKKTLSGVPSSMGDVSTAIGGISQKLGLTGAPLQKLSTQILTLSRITKTDLNANIQAVTGTFNQWGISAADQGTKLDELFRVSQKTGISVTQLGETMSSGGVRFREAGLSFEQSASLLGLLAKNGLDANAVMPALSRALATAAKDGKPAQQVFQDTFEAIRNAPNDTEAAGVALKVFGARAGPQFAALIREGKLSYEDFSKAIAEGGDTIMEAANQTDDWREKLETLKNKALVALEPVASRVFEGLTNLIGFAADAIERFSKSPAWELIRDTILPGIGHAFQDFLFAFQNPDTAIKASGWEGVVFRIGAAFGKAFRAIKAVVGEVVDFVVRNLPTVQEVVTTVLDAIGIAAGWISDTVLPALQRALQVTIGWITDQWPKIQAAFEATVDWLKGQDWKGLFAKIKTGYQASADWIVSKGIPDLGTAWQWLKDQAQALATYISTRWDDIQKAVDNVITYLKVLLVEFFGPIVFIWQAAHDQILDIVRIAWDTVKLYVETALNVIKGIIDVVLGLLSGDWGRAWDGLKQIVGSVWDLITGLVKLGAQALTDILNGAWEVIKAAADLAWHAFLSIITTVADQVVDFVSKLPGRFVDALGDLLSLLVEKGNDLLQGLWNGIKAVALDVATWFGELPGKIQGWLGSLLETLRQHGADLLAGLIAGLEAGAVALAVWLLGLPGKVVGWVGDVAHKLFQKGVDFVQGMIDGVKSKAADLAFEIANLATLGVAGASVGSGKIAKGLADGTKSAGGRLATSPIVSLIGEAGNEAVINGDQAVRLLWLMANGGTPAASGPTSSGQTVNINVQAEAKVADADELYSVFRRGELLVGARR